MTSSKGFWGWRYFALHSVANLFSSVMAVPAVLAWLRSPVEAGNVTWEEPFSAANLWSPVSHWPSYWVIAIHGYHMLLRDLFLCTVTGMNIHTAGAHG